MRIYSFGVIVFAVILSATTSSAAEMKYPLSAAVTPDGAVYVADRNLPGIWKIVDGKATVFHQASKKFRTPLNAVRCLAVDSKGRLLAGDSATREIYQFDKDGKPKPLSKGQFGIPMAIAADGKGMLFVCDLETQRIWKISEEGGKREEFAVISGPRGIAIDAKSRVWVVNASKNQVVRYTPDGKIEPVTKGRPFMFPHNIVLDAKGVAYVSDGYGKAIWKIDAAGKPTKWVSGAPLVNPVGLTFQGKNLLVVDSRANAVFSIDAAGKLKTVVAGKPAK